jgi:hypothetical protein
MKTFGFPQICCDGGGGDGGGGDGGEGDWEDAYAEANDHTDFSSQDYDIPGLNADNFADPDQLGAEAYENQDLGYGVDTNLGAWGPGATDVMDTRGPATGTWGYSASTYGPFGAQETGDPFGFSPTGPGGPTGPTGQGFADAWGNTNVGYNTNPSGPVGMSGPGGDPWGFDDRGASVWANPGNLSTVASNPDQGWSSPFGQTSPGPGWGPGSVMDGRFAGLPGRGIEAWSPGPSVGTVEVARGPDGQTYGGPRGSLPAGAGPTASFGLPAANHPGARAGEIDWAAVSNAGLDTISSNVRGNMSTEAIAMDQARHIPRPNGSGGWLTDTRGNVGLDLLQMEADHYAPYQWAPGQWISNTRGNLPAEDPEVQAVIARLRG